MCSFAALKNLREQRAQRPGAGGKALPRDGLAHIVA
jgi:hypothetical protein